jgi:hypothetical protein
VSGGSGCLRALAEALSSAAHPLVQAPLSAALQDFFKRIVGGDPVVVQEGDSTKVLAVLQPQPFQSTSALFFGTYLNELLRFEDSLTKLGRERLRNFALDKANQVVAAFERKFKGQRWKDIESVGFTHFFRVLQGEPEWLAEQLRKDQ